MDREHWKKAWSLARKILFPVLIAIVAMAMAQTLPFDLAILGAGEVLVYLEVIVVVWLGARVGGVKAARGFVGNHVGRLVSRLRRRRVAKPKRLSPSNEDDPEPVWQLLAAA